MTPLMFAPGRIDMTKALASFSLRVEPVENGFVIHETGPVRENPGQEGTRHVAANTTQLVRLLDDLARKHIERIGAQYNPPTEANETDSKG